MTATRELSFVVDHNPTRVTVFLAWTARVAVVATFVFIGSTKFSNNPRSEWIKVFEQIGWGQWFRYFTGVVQVGGALLLATPWTITIGAFLLCCTMVGAAIVDATVMHSPGVALVPLVLLGIVAATWFAGTFGPTSQRGQP